jgi:hypothetical protein
MADKKKDDSIRGRDVLGWFLVLMAIILLLTVFYKYPEAGFLRFVESMGTFVAAYVAMLR